MLCIWRERNVRSFEYRETIMLEPKKIVLQSLYTWRVTWNNLPLPVKSCATLRVIRLEDCAPMHF